MANNDLLIKNATIVTGNQEGGVVENAALAVAGGKISYMGGIASAPAGAAREIDAGGDILMPGFFNAHTHTPMTVLRCYADDLALQDWLENKIFPAEGKLTDEIVYWSALAAMCEFAAAGVVGFTEMYSNCDAIMRAVKQSGHRAVMARGVVSFTQRMADEKIAEAIDCYEKYNDGDRINVFFSPHAQFTVDNATLARIAELAKGYDTGIHVHISETKREHDECVAQHGKTPVALFEELGLLDVPLIGAHCVWVTDEDIRILARHGATVASCPRSNLKLASGIAPLKKMLEAGVNVALGTDGAASNNKLSMMSEMTYASFLQKGVTGDPEAIPARQAIRMATRNGALAMGFDSGELTVGKNADFIMLDTSGVRYSPAWDAAASVVYASSDGDVKMTVVGGDIIYENGVCNFADVSEIKERLERYAKVIGA